MTTVGDDMPVEQARCRELLTEYRKIKPVGLYTATMIEQALRQADRAIISGDIVEILRAYEKLKSFQ